MAIISYSKTQSDKFEELAERKRLKCIINDTYFITKNESEKRNRIIDKTENDILKIEHEICKEKTLLEKKYFEESARLQKTFSERMAIQLG